MKDSREGRGEKEREEEDRVSVGREENEEKLP